MALTKTQINYLENKLDRLVADKLQAFREELGEEKTLQKEIIDRLNLGEIKLLSYDGILDVIRDKYQKAVTGYYYCRSIDIEELISKKDRNAIQKDIDAREDKIRKYSGKLYSAKQNAVDKFVLEGINLEDAIKELDKVK